MAMNREQKRMMQRQGYLSAEGEPVARQRSAPAQNRPRERTSPVQFLKEVRGELRKVVWPTRHEVVNYSIVVLVALVVFTAFTALVDWVFSEGILTLFNAR